MTDPDNRTYGPWNRTEFYYVDGENFPMPCPDNAIEWDPECGHMAFDRSCHFCMQMKVWIDDAVKRTGQDIRISPARRAGVNPAPTY